MEGGSCWGDRVLGVRDDGVRDDGVESCREGRVWAWWRLINKSLGKSSVLSFKNFGW